MKFDFDTLHASLCADFRARHFISAPAATETAEVRPLISEANAELSRPWFLAAAGRFMAIFSAWIAAPSLSGDALEFEMRIGGLETRRLVEMLCTRFLLESVASRLLQGIYTADADAAASRADAALDMTRTLMLTAELGA